MIYKTFIYMGHSKKYEEEKPLHRVEEKKKPKNYNTLKGRPVDPDDLLDDDDESFEKFKHGKR